MSSLSLNYSNKSSNCTNQSSNWTNQSTNWTNQSSNYPYQSTNVIVLTKVLTILDQEETIQTNKVTNLAIIEIHPTKEVTIQRKLVTIPTNVLYSS